MPRKRNPREKEDPYKPNYTLEQGIKLNGARVKKLFDDGVFYGTVEFCQKEYNERYAFLVTWDDSDEEGMDYDEVMQHIIIEGQHVLCPVPCALCPVSCVLCPVSCVLCPVPCALCPVSCVLCPFSLTDTFTPHRLAIKEIKFAKGGCRCA